jgi:phosphoglycerate dehydrogenase-like enzyme
MTRRPVVLLDPSYRRVEDIFSPVRLEKLNSLAEVVWGRDDAMPPEAARDALREADVLIGTDWRYGDALEGARNLRAVVSIGGNFPEGLDYDLCFSRGIRVLSCAWAFGPQVAEMALGLAIAAGRQICAQDAAMRNGTETYFENADSTVLYDKKVGLIGYGGLARSLQPLLAPFRCEVSVYDPWLTEGYVRSCGVKPVDLQTLIGTSQVIFVLAVPTVDNQALLSRQVLEQIRPGAMLVLVSRAHVVDFGALTEMVLAKRFKAAIDVFPVEPLPKEHPIRRASWAVLSPHRAGCVKEAWLQIGDEVVDDVESILRGLPPQRMQVAQPELVRRYSVKGFHAGLA